MTVRWSLFAGFAMGIAAVAAPNPTPITFNKDILPILQKNCQTCHRPGEVAPMSLLTYSEARPWAKAIKTAVVTQKMPPWFADPTVGHFSNERKLTPAEIAALVEWADNGAPEGDAKDKPAPLTFQDGWNIKPDLVIEMPNDFQIPAKGTINYQYIRVKGNIDRDLWVTAAEMRPGNPAVLHHGKVWVVPPGSHYMENAEYGVPYERGMGKNSTAEGNDILGKFNPGLGAQSFDIDGSAKFIPKGSDFVFELHYTAVGKATTDRSKLGLVLAKNPPETRYFFSAGPTAINLAIPAGDENAEVVSEVTVGLDDAKLVYAQPHMHLRGKDFELRAIYPTGETETLFKGKFNFDWQIGYQFAKPIPLPKGTRLIGISHFDNSANNRFNPDPTKNVKWGPQNWDEMSNCFVGLIFSVKDNPAKLFKRSGPSLLPRGESGPTLAALQ
ncbi:MAG TPA: cytochrome c [Bryobacteraceae bacterium]|nr:cytochrome c [Bryobacteraceae bacterium]